MRFRNRKFLALFLWRFLRFCGFQNRMRFQSLPRRDTLTGEASLPRRIHAMSNCYQLLITERMQQALLNRAPCKGSRQLMAGVIHEPTQVSGEVQDLVFTCIHPYSTYIYIPLIGIWLKERTNFRPNIIHIL